MRSQQNIFLCFHKNTVYFSIILNFYVSIIYQFLETLYDKQSELLMLFKPTRVCITGLLLSSQVTNQMLITDEIQVAASKKKLVNYNFIFENKKIN